MADDEQPKIQMRVPPGMQMPSPDQVKAIQKQITADAEKMGMSVPQFVAYLREQQAAKMQQAAAAGGAAASDQPPQTPAQAQQRLQGSQAQQQQQQQQQQQPQQRRVQHRLGPNTQITPSPAALAVAQFLRGQDLKSRTSILSGERKDMFKVKRALRALQSPAYEKARRKNPLLPAITDRLSLENTFKLLPMSMLALRVSKTTPEEGSTNSSKGGKGGSSGSGKRVKGLWTVKIESQQDVAEDMYYVWFYEGSQVMRKVYAALALVVIFILVLYPLWPLKLRLGVYYLSWGFLGLLGLFFAMAIFRVVLFCVTYVVLSPGLWLYPNLWEDVSFFDSFRPVWAWHDPNPPKKKGKSKKREASSSAAAAASPSVHDGQAAAINSTANVLLGQNTAQATTTASDAHQLNVSTPDEETSTLTERKTVPSVAVEDVEE